MHARSSRPIPSRSSASRRDNRRYFPCAADTSPSLVEEWGLRGSREGAGKVKNRKVSPAKLAHSPIPRLRCCRRRRRDIDSIQGGFAWSFVWKGRTQVPGPASRNRQFPRSAFGNTEPLPKVKGFPFVFLRFYPFLPLRFRPSAFLYIRTCVHTRTHTRAHMYVYIQESVCERGHSRFRYIPVVDIYGCRASCTFSTFIYVYTYVPSQYVHLFRAISERNNS